MFNKVLLICLILVTIFSSITVGASKPKKKSKFTVHYQLDDFKWKPALPELDSQLRIQSRRIKEQEVIVRGIRTTGVNMYEDSQAKLETQALQTMVQHYILLRHGPGPHYVEIQLTFPTFTNTHAATYEASIIMEVAPEQLVPYSAYKWLQIVDHFNSGSFHRIPRHVVQAQVRGSDLTSLAFQEYSPEYPHERLTMGFAGRPGGPAFYISAVNNTKNHGPGSQNTKTGEADSCFGRILVGEDVLLRMLNLPVKSAKSGGFLSNSKEWVTISDLKLVSYSP